MKSSKSYTIHPKYLRNAKALRRAQSADSTPRSVPPPPASTVRTTPRDFANPVDYQHPYESMGRFAQAPALRYDAYGTRHAYYRQLDIEPVTLLSPYSLDEPEFGRLNSRKERIENTIGTPRE